MWKKPSPQSRKQAESSDVEDGKNTRKARRQTQPMSVQERLLKGMVLIKKFILKAFISSRFTDYQVQYALVT